MIRKYLSHRKSLFLINIISGGCYFLLLLLSASPKDIIRYGALMHFTVLLLFCAFDYPAFARKVRSLNEINENLREAPQEYPEAANALEEQYLNIIGDLYAMLSEQRDKYDASRKELIDYYTLWLHQIKTPISAICLTAESPAPSGAMILREIFKISRYVEMALQYVRMEDISSDMVATRCELDKVISECIKKYSDLFIYKNLSVTFEKSGAVVTTDEKWLTFIIEQFLSNAIKYTNLGGVKFYFSERTLFIEDTGIGILPRDIPRIFEKGYTGHNGRLDKKASGLGLHMAKTISEKLGLTLGVTSSPSGSCASIYFGNLTEM
ncbi:MAG: HAMP domain-containing histidine kinase [Eubacteriaceae bacterium]|nr:HAMP domain-containing histidine kinase [Eubacteriaceae bacterium]